MFYTMFFFANHQFSCVILFKRVINKFIYELCVIVFVGIGSPVRRQNLKIEHKNSEIMSCIVTVYHLSSTLTKVIHYDGVWWNLELIFGHFSFRHIVVMHQSLKRKFVQKVFRAFIEGERLQMLEKLQYWIPAMHINQMYWAYHQFSLPQRLLPMPKSRRVHTTKIKTIAIINVNKKGIMYTNSPFNSMHGIHIIVEWKCSFICPKTFAFCINAIAIKMCKFVGW